MVQFGDKFRDKQSLGIFSYACSLVHSEQSWWALKRSMIFVWHTCIIAVTTA
jgi:hypothetical protein